MKRSIALLLSALVLFGALFSCAGKKETKNEDGIFTSADFPDCDYKGEEFTFLVVKHTETIEDYYGGSFIDTDTYTGTTASDAVYERNLAVEEKYNVRIGELVKISSDPGDVINSYRMSGDICFDAVYGWGYKLAACVPNGCFTDISAIPGIYLSRSYWAPSALDDLMIGDSLYTAASDISMNRLKWADVVFLNNTVAQSKNISEDPVSLALDGKWTYDTYLKLISDVSDESSPGLVTDDATGAGLAHGSDIYYAEQKDGSASLSLFSEKLMSLIDATHPIYSDSSKVVAPEYATKTKSYIEGEDPWDYALSFFTQDLALFCCSSAQNYSAIKGAGADYSILPVPKHDENQSYYNATVSPLASMFAIVPEVRGGLKTASYERTGIILEYMSYKSYEILYPKFSAEMLYADSEGNVRNSDIRLLDIIHESTRYEFCELYALTEITNIAKAMFQNPEAAEATYSRQQKTLQKKLTELYKTLPYESDQ